VQIKIQSKLKLVFFKKKPPFFTTKYLAAIFSLKIRKVSISLMRLEKILPHFIPIKSCVLLTWIYTLGSSTHFDQKLRECLLREKDQKKSKKTLFIEGQISQ